MQNNQEQQTNVGASLVDTHELAGILGVTKRTVQNLIKRRQIPRIRVGNRNRFQPDRVVAALAEGTPKGGAK
jgi:excisionase family DNA binding protein